MTIFVLIVLSVVAYVIYTYRAFKARVAFALAYSKTVHPYNKKSNDHSKTLLVLGDSTGTSIGATSPEDSVAARFANLIGATYVENIAASGSQVSSLATQIANAQLPHYDVALVHIGANDIVRFHDVKKIGEELGKSLDILKTRTQQIFLMSAADVGTATLFPTFVRPFHSWETQKYHKEFARVCTEHGASYVNLYEPRASDLFVSDPEHYLAPDRFHPSSLGYGVWFEKLKNVYETQLQQ